MKAAFLECFFKFGVKLKVSTGWYNQGRLGSAVAGKVLRCLGLGSDDSDSVSPSWCPASGPVGVLRAMFGSDMCV